MKRPTNSSEEAAYQWIVDQLAKGTAPETIEANLIHQGSDAKTAHLLVTRVVDEMPGTLQARYTWQLYSSLGVFALALLLALGISFLSLLGAPISFKGILRTWVAALLWMMANGYWILVSFWKLQLAHRLEKVRAARLRDSGAPLPVLPADSSSAPAVARRPALPQQMTSKSPSPAVSRPIPRDGRSRLVRSAIDKREDQGLRWVGLCIGGSAALLLALSCCVVVPVLVVVSRFQRDEEASSSVSSLKEEVDPNAPDPHEGPPPRGWTVLFRSDDASVWNTDSPGAKFALPVRRAHSKISYLRLKRLDTDDSQILPISHKQLGRTTFPAEGGGYSWNGTATLGWGGRHLGIAQAPRHKFPAPKGLIIIAVEGWDVWVGSGFGHKCFVDDTQYYCWKGQEIGRTVFEIAVTTESLTKNEKRFLVK